LQKVYSQVRLKDKFTVPVGVDVEINANQGTIHLLESAVV
jgi:hypothetical protein